MHMHTRAGMAIAAIAAATLLLTGCTPGGDSEAATAAAKPAADTTITIDQGTLTGVATASGVEYLGLPYAKPPVGELRWHEPEPAAGWEGTLDASKAGPDCPQPVNGDSDGSLSENCLYLNVYAPAASKKKEDKLPVVVFLHGGGYTGGTPNIYDGRDFTATGEAIAVIPAFRVGLFGFFPTSTEESEFGAQGNWGLLDQQEALRWVQENIDAFGGDPENVTIVGESAGAGSVCFQLASPTAAGLFDKAAIQSIGACSVSDTPVSTAAYSADWGCAEGDLACLRAVPAASVVGAGSGFGFAYPSSGGPDQPVGPDEAAQNGTLADVPLLMGVTSDEWLGFASANYPLDPAEYEAMVAGQFGDAAPAVLEAYPADAGPDPVFALGWLSGDSQFACPALATADAFSAVGRDVYFYEFADRTAPGWRDLGSPFPPSSLDLGATHTTDLQYLFNYEAAQRALDEEQSELSDDMVELWLSFMQSGEPALKGAPEWTTFADGAEVLQLKTAAAGGIEMIDTFSDAHNCELWSSLR